MTDTISRPLRMPRESFTAVDEAVATGGFASADDLIRTAVEEFLGPMRIIEGDELDALLDEAECGRDEYLDGPTVMARLRAKYEALANAAE